MILIFYYTALETLVCWAWDHWVRAPYPEMRLLWWSCKGTGAKLPVARSSEILCRVYAVWWVLRNLRTFAKRPFRCQRLASVEEVSLLLTAVGLCCLWGTIACLWLQLLGQLPALTEKINEQGNGTWVWSDQTISVYVIRDVDHQKLVPVKACFSSSSYRPDNLSSNANCMHWAKCFCLSFPMSAWTQGKSALGLSALDIWGLHVKQLHVYSPRPKDHYVLSPCFQVEGAYTCLRGGHVC